jgi:hypothetical protein
MKYLYNYLLLITVAGIALNAIIENISFPGISDSILVKPVPEKKFRSVSTFNTTVWRVDTIRENVYIEKENTRFIRFEKPQLLFSLFKPDKIFIFDNLYCMLVLSLCVLLFIRISRLNHSSLFGDAALDTIKFSAILVVLFWLIDYGRHLLITNYIEKITENKYTLEKRSLFNSPLYLVTILLLIFRNIIKSGNYIQKDQDLTI